jgi:5-methylthioadenosine/S-adenosylhomocysteine deaminase
MDPHRRVIREGALAVQDEKIVAVSKDPHLRKEFPSAEVVDAKGKIVLPGLIDSHVHLTQTLARGLADQVNVPDWLYKRIFPYEISLTPEDVYCNAILCCLEMIRTGTTCFADPGGYQMEHAEKAVEDSGMRGILAIASVDKQDEQHPVPEQLQMSTDEVVKANERLIRTYHGKANGRIRIWAALRGMLNVTQDLIVGLNTLAREHRTGIQVHAAFWKDNVEWVRKHTGFTDVNYLENLGVLGPNWLMIHMGWVTDEEIDILKKRDVKISYCPGPAMKMPLGTNINKKIPLMVRRGVNVSLGCDSAAANNSLDMFRAMWLNSIIHKEMFLDSLMMSPEETLEMATIRSAKCLLWDQEIGSIEKGKKADLIILDPKASNLVPAHDFSLISNLVYSGEGSNVETVMVNGKFIMQNRRVLTIDEDAILDRAQGSSDRIVGRLQHKLRPTWPIS